MHKARESYVVAANAILVVAVLIATLTYSHCPTLLEATKLKKVLEVNGLLDVQHFHPGDVVVLTRVAFFLSILSTTYAAYAALPFSFGFFFYRAVDNARMKRLLYRTRELIVLVSYCLMLLVGALARVQLHLLAIHRPIRTLQVDPRRLLDPLTRVCGDQRSALLLEGHKSRSSKRRQPSHTRTKEVHGAFNHLKAILSCSRRALGGLCI